MRAKIRKKELKEPDFLQSELAELVQFFLRHKIKLYILLTLLILAVAAAGGWYLYRLNYEKSAQKVYDRVIILSSKSSVTQDEINILVNGFRNVALKYPRSRASLYSYYRLGNLYLNANQPDLAIGAYSEFINKASNKNYLKVFAYMGKGYCHDIKKDFKKAMLSFEYAMKINDGDIIKGQIYRDMARVCEQMNDRKNALEYYRKALEKTIDPIMRSIIKRKIATIS